MTLSTGPERDLEHAKLLLEEYCFDLGGFQVGELVAIWQERLQAEPSWIRGAVLEALYLGRYKAFSVEQILQGWKRRGHPVRHFNSEFERVVFGPIDPTIAKYASMTTLSPSELMLPQTDVRKEDSSPPQAAAIAPPSIAAPAPSAEARPGVESATVPQAAPEQQELFPATEVSPADSAEISPASESHDATGQPSATQAANSLFSQPEPIQKFTPQPEPSEFYQRLQAVARHSE